MKRNVFLSDAAARVRDGKTEAAIGRAGGNLT